MDADMSGEPFLELVRLMALLRGPEGCPWDQEQTHDSIRHNLLEEAYELAEAIDDRDDRGMQEELGDLLLQIVFHAQMAAERGAFDIDDVAQSINAKLIRRHPHVFGGERLATAGDVLGVWEELKREEKQEEPFLDSVPRTLPALLYAYNLQKKAARVGLDWEDIGGVSEKLQEELDELQEARHVGEAVIDELGDVLFTMVNLARFLGIDPEDALRRSADSFRRRVQCMERMAAQGGASLADLGAEELDVLWERAKQEAEGETT